MKGVTIHPMPGREHEVTLLVGAISLMAEAAAKVGQELLTLSSDLDKVGRGAEAERAIDLSEDLLVAVKAVTKKMLDAASNA